MANLSEHKRILIGIIIAILVIFIAIYMFYFANVDSYEEHIYGLWIADEQFCDESGIDTMMLFIGEYDDGERNAYLVIKSGDKFISNQGLEIEYKRGRGGILIRPYTIKTECQFDIDQTWPEDVKFTFDVITGTLRIHDDENIYAKLYRENSLSKLFTD